MELMDKSILDNIIYLDIVTKGYDEFFSEIIEINAIKIKETRICTFTKIIKSSKDIFKKEYRSDRTNAKEFNIAFSIDEIRCDILNFIGNYPLVCFDGDFISKIITRFLPEIKNPILNTMELAAILEPWKRDYTMDYLISEITNFSEENVSYNKLRKVIYNMKIVNALLCRQWEREEKTLQRKKVSLYDVLVREYALEKRWNWTKYLSRPVLFSFEGYDYVNYDENKISKLEFNSTKISYKEYEDLLKRTHIWTNGGDFGYQYREQQRVFAEKIRINIEKEEKIFIEAPTGSGKTFAYVLIVALKAYINKGSYKAEDASFIISTDTKELQNQLISKDIPNILMKLGLDNKLKYGSIKGKSNYICTEKLEKSQKFNGDLKSILAEIFLKRLCKDGKYGDVENISYFAYNHFLLEKYLSDVICDNEGCNIEKCFKCCFLKNRYNELPLENITVINHSLLANWPYSEKKRITHLIIDEAHNLMEKCYDFFSEEFNSEEFQDLLKCTYEKEPTIYRQLTNLNASNSYRENVELSKIKYWVSEIETNISILLNKAIELKVSNGEYNFRSEYFLAKDVLKDKVQAFGPYISKIKENIYGMYRLLNRYFNNITLEGEEGKENNDFRIVNNFIMKLKSSYDILDMFLEDLSKQKSHAKIIEISKDYSFFKVINIPLNIEALVADRILKDVKSTAFLSATMRINNSFSKIKNFLGQKKANELVVPESFKLKEKTKIFVLKDIGRYDSNGFVINSSKFIYNMALKLNGHMLVLFTNNLRKKAVEEELIKLIKGSYLEVYTNKKSLNYLKDKNRQIIILGSKGFFEGIDIPGDALTCVMIDKIPNKSLEDPLVKAITTYKKENYTEINYPQACIKLKQIYGRLIRSVTDYGYFCILDGGKNNNMLNKLEKDLYGPKLNYETSNSILKNINNDYSKWRMESLREIIKEVKDKHGAIEDFKIESQKINSFWVCKEIKNEEILFKNINFTAKILKSNFVKK